MEPRIGTAAGRYPRVGALAALGGIVLAALVAVPLSPAQARLADPPPTVEPAVGESTDVLVDSLGAGLTITGLQPPTPITPDPLEPYPLGAEPIGYESVTTFAGAITVTSVSDPGLTAPAYCIDLRVDTAVGVGYEHGTWAGSEVPNLGYVSYVVNSFFPTTSLPGDLANDDQRAAAVQAAIWYFTDGFVVSPSNPDIQGATAAIVIAAQAAGPVAEPPAPNVTVTPPDAAGPMGTAVGPFLVEAAGAAEVAVTVPAGHAMFSDASATAPVPSGSTVPTGTGLWITSESTAADQTVLSARAAVSVQRGQVYHYDGNLPGRADAQHLVLATTAILDVVTHATATFLPVGTLRVTKTIRGDGAGRQGASRMVIDCGQGHRFTSDLAPGATGVHVVTFGDIPAGRSCVVTEPVTGANSVVDVTTNAPRDTAIAEGDNTVDVTNTVTIRSIPSGSGSTPQRLPATGADAAGPLLTAGIATFLLGGLAVIIARRRRRA